MVINSTLNILMPSRCYLLISFPIYFMDIAVLALACSVTLKKNTGLVGYSIVLFHPIKRSAKFLYKNRKYVFVMKTDSYFLALSFYKFVILALYNCNTSHAPSQRSPYIIIFPIKVSAFRNVRRIFLCSF